MLQNFADDLKNLRESKNISITEIANQTKISHTAFERIESGDFTFQPQTYIRAFIKQYALALDLDPDDLIKDYDLAKSGKYTPKTSSDTSKDITSEPGAEDGQKEKESEKLSSDPIMPPVKHETPAQDPLIKPENEKKVSKDTNYGSRFTKEEQDKSSYHLREKAPASSPKSFDTSILKTVGTVIIVLLLAAGLYFLITNIFFNGKKNTVEIERQNFDDVVEQNEKTILGKRTEAEIQDSIRKAEEQRLLQIATLGDTLRLTITSTKKGTFSIVPDSANFIKPEKVEFGPNEIGEWKANKHFILSSPNTSTFIAKINGNIIQFPSKVADKVKITKDGIAK